MKNPTKTSNNTFMVHFVLFVWSFVLMEVGLGQNQPTEIKLGVVLDLQTSFSKICLTSINMSLSDFYKEHPDYTTRLNIHVRDSMEDVVQASAAEFQIVFHLRNSRTSQTDMGKHSYSQTSSSSLQVWSAGETEVNFQPPISGIPDKCFCGGETVLKFSTTDKTRGRIFIGCRDHKEGDGGGDLSTTDKTRGRIFIGCHDHKKGYGGGDHIMKWWDEAITEELQEIKERAAYSVRQDYEDTLWFQQELSKVKAQMEEVRLSERRRLALVNNMLLAGIILIVVLVSLVI